MHPNEELRELCAAALADGADFPTIWENVLELHPLVVGIPVSVAGPALSVPLADGAQLIWRDGDFELMSGEGMP